MHNTIKLKCRTTIVCSSHDLPLSPWMSHQSAHDTFWPKALVVTNNKESETKAAWVSGKRYTKMYLIFLSKDKTCLAWNSSQFHDLLQAGLSCILIKLIAPFAALIVTLPSNVSLDPSDLPMIHTPTRDCTCNLHGCRPHGASPRRSHAALINSNLLHSVASSRNAVAKAICSHINTVSLFHYKTMTTS